MSFARVFLFYLYTSSTEIGVRSSGFFDFGFQFRLRKTIRETLVILMVLSASSITYFYFLSSEANASTIMFWIHKVCPMDGWPQHRREEQNYMMFTIESTSETIPYYNRTMLTDTWFNTTVNYRIDSTVFMPNDALTRITKDTPKEDIWDKKEVILALTDIYRLRQHLPT